MTAETALAMPAVVLLLGLVVTVGQAVLTQVRCVDAARAAARLAARGESAERVLAAARAAAPAGAEVGVSSGGAVVRVRVASGVRLPLAAAPALTVEGTAVTEVEQP